MVEVEKNGQLFPFSRGIMAKSISKTGISVQSSYDIVDSILDKLQEKNIKNIESEDLSRMVSKELIERNRKMEQKFYKLHRSIRDTKKPVFILIGGSAGVGKSTIASDLGHRLGIRRVIGTDTIREIMRSVLSPEIVPTLYVSSFEEAEINTTFVNNRNIYCYEQQVRLVSKGIKSILKRGITEGLTEIVNGVHIVPGFLFNDNELNERSHVFQYIIDVHDKEKHISHFQTREEGSNRPPSRYIDSISKIKKVQEYINRNAEQSDVKIIENEDFHSTINTILNDLSKKLNK